ncbi:serine hydrolase domain-containing protein [Microbacterium sp. NPDC058342]|uniref:serine hydrolase domain-containing protein n=1 Tax=Microbacterium sp. NPDC058342 TaxID=3346454 RepID=UPI00365BBFF7
MTVQSAAERLLELGDAGTHPASAIVGIQTHRGTEVATAGRASLQGPGTVDVPLSREHLIDIASITKVASTTTIIMRLVDEGALRLSDRVGAFLPGFTSGEKDRVTLAELLTHTSGLPPWWPLYMEARDRDSAIAHVQRLPLVTSPGTARSYSDLGLILAGAVVERVTESPLQEAYRTFVADPLRLRSRYGPIPAESAAAAADSDAYEYAMIRSGRPFPVPFAAESFDGWRDHPVRGEVNDGNTAHAMSGVSGHAGLFSTVDDLLTLGSALRGEEFVSEAVLREFSAPSRIEPSQAIGFRRYALPVGGQQITLLGHTGFTGTWFAFGLDREFVIAGAAMRLYGTVGRLPTAGDDASLELPDLVGNDPIYEVLFDAAVDTLADGPAPATSEAAER